MHNLKTTIKAKNELQGFTLIELMIVMSIVALLMSLVGPLTIKSYEKVKAKEEMLTLKNWIKGNSYRSFATAKRGEITLSENTVAFHYADNGINDTMSDSEKRPIASKTFEYLSFNTQQIAVNTFGLVSKNSITVQLNGKIIALILSENTKINDKNNDI